MAINGIIEVTVEKCVGCHTCELECALAHSKSETFVQALYSREPVYPRIILEVDGDDVIPMHCRHCTDAPCIAACPTSAMSRAGLTKPVRLDLKKCIGCNACVMVCPFGMIQTMPGRPALTKCDLCAERLEKDLEPACSASCPTKAIRFTQVNDVAADKRAETVRKFRVSMAQSETLRISE